MTFTILTLTGILLVHCIVLAKLLVRNKIFLVFPLEVRHDLVVYISTMLFFLIPTVYAAFAG